MLFRFLSLTDTGGLSAGKQWRCQVVDETSFLRLIGHFVAGNHVLPPKHRVSRFSADALGESIRARHDSSQRLAKLWRMGGRFNGTRLALSRLGLLGIVDSRTHEVVVDIESGSRPS